VGGDLNGQPDSTRNESLVEQGADLSQKRYEEIPGMGVDAQDDVSSFALYETAPTYRAVRDFTDLRVWQLGVDLAAWVYEHTRDLPSHERFGLASQLQRAAVSVPSSIPEGNARNRTAEYLRFLFTARGSLAEIKTQWIIAGRLRYLDERTVSEGIGMIDDLMKQLTALYTAVEKSSRSGK
jgi:four helix bundle protein